MSAITMRGWSSFLYVMRHESFRRKPLAAKVPVNVPVARATLPFGLCGTTCRAFIFADSLRVSAVPPKAGPLAAASAVAVTTAIHLST
jgi:hypothetical protein